MSDKSLISSIQSLMGEFLSSKMSIDDFLRTKLSAKRKGGDDRARRLIEAFSEIDENYVSLQSARSKGVNRQEWMRERLDAAIVDTSSGRGNDVAGIVFAKSIDALNSSPAGTTQERCFDGLDAIDTTADLERALTKNALDSISKSGEAK